MDRPPSQIPIAAFTKLATIEKSYFYVTAVLLGGAILIPIVISLLDTLSIEFNHKIPSLLIFICTIGYFITIGFLIVSFAKLLDGLGGLKITLSDDRFQNTITYARATLFISGITFVLFILSTTLISMSAAGKYVFLIVTFTSGTLIRIHFFFMHHLMAEVSEHFSLTTTATKTSRSAKLQMGAIFFPLIVVGLPVIASMTDLFNELPMSVLNLTTYLFFCALVFAYLIFFSYHYYKMFDSASRELSEKFQSYGYLSAKWK